MKTRIYEAAAWTVTTTDDSVIGWIVKLEPGKFLAISNGAYAWQVQSTRNDLQCALQYLDDWYANLPEGARP